MRRETIFPWKRHSIRGTRRREMGQRVATSLVDRQIREWERNRLREQARKEEDKIAPPLISISRQLGSGGAAIAEDVAKKMKFQLLDKTIVEAIASRTGTREHAVRTLEERGIGLLEESIRAALEPMSLTKSTYMKHLTEVLIVAAEHGCAVVMGRGAHFLLHQYPVFRVRVIAPLNIRIGRVSLRESIPFKEAEKKVRKIEAERADFIRNNFHTDINDPSHYDLVLNTEKMSFKQAALMIGRSYGIMFPMELMRTAK
jgi:cytidylate kinase